ncbi:hypothetical protein D3C80_1505540 [compost metagenome]
MAALVVKHGRHQPIPFLLLAGGRLGLVHPVRHPNPDAGRHAGLLQLAARRRRPGLQLPGELIAGLADVAAGLGRCLPGYLAHHGRDIGPRHPIKLEIDLDVRGDPDAGIMGGFCPARGGIHQGRHHTYSAEKSHLLAALPLVSPSVISIKNQ